MSYFDFLLRYSFQTAPDGRRVFSPWAGFGRAYVIGSEFEYERLRRQTKFGLIVAFVLVIVGEVALQRLALPPYLFGFVWLAVGAATAGWTQHLVHHAALPIERLSQQESWILQARAGSPVSLRWPMMGSIAFVALGVILLAIDPVAKWHVATETIIFFGFCAVVSMFMLVMRRRSQGSI